MCDMHIATTDIEKMILERLRSLTGNTIVTIEPEAKIPGIATLDYRLCDDHGQEYFVELKPRRITKLDVGQLATYATLLHKKMPSAKLVLISKKVEPIHKEVLKGLGVEVIEHYFANSERTVGMIPPERIGKKLELSPKEQESYFLLLRKGIVVVTPGLLSKELRVPNEYSKNILASLAKKGMLSRFGRGKYVIISPDVVYGRKGYTIDPIAMLEQLMGGEPYYVAYASALYIHGLSHQLPFETTVAISKQRRSVKVGSSAIKFVRIMAKAMFGYKQQKYLNSYVSVSDLEKTIIDCIDRHDLCGGISEVTRSLSESLQQIDREKLLSYLKKFRKRVVVQRLGFILEKLASEGFEVDSKLLQDMKKSLKFKHIYRLDFTQPKSGGMSKEWKIIENVDCISWKRQNAQSN